MINEKWGLSMGCRRHTRWGTKHEKKHGYQIENGNPPESVDVQGETKFLVSSIVTSRYGVATMRSNDNPNTPNR